MLEPGWLLSGVAMQRDLLTLRSRAIALSHTGKIISPATREDKLAEIKKLFDLNLVQEEQP